MPTSEPRPMVGQLNVSARGAKITVLDAFLRPVPDAVGFETLTVSLPPGAYEVCASIGATEVTETVLVSTQGPPRRVVLRPGFATAAPVFASGTSNETHAELAEDLLGMPAPGWGRLIVVLRGLRDRPMAPLPKSGGPAPAIRLASGSLVALPAPAPDARLKYQPKAENRALGWAVDVPAGGCRVRWETPSGQPVEHALWVPAGCQTLLFVPQGPAGPVPSDASVQVVPGGSGWPSAMPAETAVETTLGVLRTRSSRPRPDVWERVLDDWSSPLMLTLLTLHEIVRSPEESWPAHPPLVDVVARLRDGLGECPDLAVLRSLLTPYDEPPPVAWPPMLDGSARLLRSFEREGRNAIAEGSLAERAMGQAYAGAPWHLYDPTGVEPPTQDGPFHSGSPDESFGLEGIIDSPPAGPSRVALERVEAFLEMTADAPGGAVHLDAVDLAERLDMPERVVRSCLEALDSG